MAQINIKPPKKKRDYPLGLDGRRLASVTEIIGKNLGWSKDALLGWAYKRGKSGESLYGSRDEAGKVGSAVHDIVSESLGGEPALMDANLREKCQPNADRIIERIRSLEWEVVYTELAMGRPEHGFAGTTDLIVKNKAGRYGVVDIKTGYVGEEVVIQLAAYAALFETVRKPEDELITWGGILQAKFGEPLNVITYTQEQIILGGSIFTSLLNVHRARIALGGG